MLRHGPHVRRHEPMRLGIWHARSIYATTALLVISGILWLGFHYFFRQEGEFGPQPHPLEYWWLRLHGAAAMLSLVALGSVMPVHIRRAWTMRKNRVTGIAMSSLLGFLTITGYALYYFAGGANRGWMSVAHWAVGLVLPIALLWHIVRGQMRRTLPLPREEIIEEIATAPAPRAPFAASLPPTASRQKSHRSAS